MHAMKMTTGCDVKECDECDTVNEMKECRRAQSRVSKIQYSKPMNDPYQALTPTQKPILDQITTKSRAFSVLTERSLANPIFIQSSRREVVAIIIIIIVLYMDVGMSITSNDCR